jgi:glycosyltransferase involved in cell wall biosynthesis
LLAGIRNSMGDLVVTMDDDLQHPPEEIPKLLSALTEELDLIYGYPETERHGILRNAASAGLKVALATTLGLGTARHVSAFRLVRRPLLDATTSNTDSGLNLDVLLSWATTRIAAVPVREDERRYGQSNYTVRRLIRHAVNMVTGYSTLPLRFVSYLGVTFALFGVAVMTYLLTHFALYGGVVPGFTFVASLISVFSGSQLFALGILGEYLGRIHFRSMNRPQYAIRSVVNPIAAGPPDQLGRGAPL